MTSKHDAWTSLRHSGNLLSPAALDALPDPGRAPSNAADALRGALVAVPSDKAADGEALSALLDVVLESLCGLHVGWRKGSAVGAGDAEKLLDGTVLKPRRVCVVPDGETLAVFTTSATRIGVGAGRRPVAQVVEYLRRRQVPLGLLTNGREWRLIWADQDGLAWVEWDADRWLDGDLLSAEAQVLRAVLSWKALTRNSKPLSPLLAAIRDTRRGQAALSKELGERVRRAVEAFLRARRPVVSPAWDAHAANDVYVAACHVVMRLVVVLFAEARELLPCDNPIYHHAYSLRGLIDQLDRLTPERRRNRTSAWPRLLGLFRLLHGGSLHRDVLVEAYGGDLFKTGQPDGDGVQRALALLETLAEPPDDDTIYRMMVLLTRTEVRVREGSAMRWVAAPVDFTELTSEYIGILYEGLLDYELHRAGDEPVVFLNLGDQPALPLDRLEGMDDKALAALVEKAKVKKAAAEEADEEGDEEEPEDADQEPDTDADPVELPEADELVLDDARAAARARAVAWGRRAAVVGKLVRAPGGKKGAQDPLFLAQLDAAAEHLVADLKLPGELYLVRWGGTRKGAGTFYTRPQLTLPTVRRTLEPLLRVNGVVRTPEELLALKVCDPAMGSGSFLVAALRVLTAATVESLHTHGRVTSVGGRTTVRCDVLPEADRELPTEGFDERLEALVRRAVVEHCLYGVDLDPLAVELGRVALWVETLDKRLPFTFLDHKLRCGDALIGTWLDRFRDYPLLAFDRQSPDLKYKGVHHPPNVWQDALKVRRSEVIAEQVDLITGQLRTTGATSDEDLKAAVDRVRRLYRDLRKVPSGRPDERARIWRERIQGDPALEKVRTVFDTWCALWFWPLDRIADAPGPQALHAPPAPALAVVKATRERLRFFHWELEFPDVFTAEGAGFDAVVGNPPWETLQPQSKEFFSNHDPLYRAYGKQDALAAQRRLFEVRSAIEEEWLAYNGRFRDKGNFVKHAAEPFGDGKDAGHHGGDIPLVRGKGGEGLHAKWRNRRARIRCTSDPQHPFRHQGDGKSYTYKMFVEIGHALLRAGGQLGVIVPSGLYTDKGSGDLRRLLLRGCAWRWLFGFENRDQIFDIHRSFKFCVCIAEKGGQTKSIQAAFMRHELEDWAELRALLAYPAERVAVFSPKSLSVLEIRSEPDLEVLTKLYTNGVLLGDDGPDGWGIQYAQGDFNMTSDSKIFITRDKAAADGFVPDGYGRWVGKGGSMLVPLLEGRPIWQFSCTHQIFEPTAGWISGEGRLVRSKYLVRTEDYSPTSRWRVGFRDVGGATNERTAIGTIVPMFPCGNVVGNLFSKSPAHILTLAGIMNSTSFDFICRTRLGGTHLNWHIAADIAAPKWKLVGASRSARIIARLALIPDVFAAHWAQLGWRVDYHRRAMTSHERLRLRAMVDANIASLYNLSRDEFSWILKDNDHPVTCIGDRAFARQLDPKGFWRVDKAVDPELRHTVLSLAAFDDLQRAITAAGGDRDAGIQAFCDQNDGDGWMLPETLCIADLGLTRTVDVGVYDDRARVAQPVRARMGERFLPWQLTRTAEESWAECEQHARAILGEEAFLKLMAETGRTPATAPPPPRPSVPAAPPTPARPDLGPLFANRST
jgi:hypothetical protein